MSGLAAVCAALVVCGLGAAVHRRFGIARSGAVPAHRRRPPMTHRLEPRRRRDHSLDQTFPDLLDLFVVTVQAGLLPVQAVADLRSIVDPVLVPGLDEVVARLDRGERFVDALLALVEEWGPRALTFVATVNAVKYVGATPVFCDSAGEHDLNIDLDRVEERHHGPQAGSHLLQLLAALGRRHHPGAEDAHQHRH